MSVGWWLSECNAAHVQVYVMNRVTGVSHLSCGERCDNGRMTLLELWHPENSTFLIHAVTLTMRGTVCAVACAGISHTMLTAYLVACVIRRHMVNPLLLSLLGHVLTSYLAPMVG